MKACASATSCDGRREAGADRPDRLIGDHEARAGRAVRQRALKLTAEHVERAPGLALGPRLPDADDCQQPGPPGRARLGGDFGVGFLVERPALGMADDDGLGARVGQHLGRDVAGVGAGRLRVAVLAADHYGEPNAMPAKCITSVAGGQIIRSTAPASGPSAGDDLLKLGRRGLEPVHLPIARNQRTARRNCHGRTLISSRLCG